MRSSLTSRARPPTRTTGGTDPGRRAAVWPDPLSPAVSDRPVLRVTVPASRLPDARLAAIRDAAPGYTVERGTPDDALAGVEIVLGQVERGPLADAAELRWIQSWSAGLDWLLEPTPPDGPAGVQVTSASGVHPVPIAEHVFAVLLALGRGLPQALAAQAQTRWSRGDEVGRFELEGRRMVLLGLGEIGSRIARIADAFGMLVTAVRHHPDEGAEPGVARVVGNEALLDILPAADVLVVTVPLTDATRGMVGPGALAALPRHAIVINVGRGEVVDQDAVAHAVADGRLGGAALDVFADEPLPADSPLWSLDNVIVTPHTAGLSPHYTDRALSLFLTNLARYQRGDAFDDAVELGAD